MGYPANGLGSGTYQTAPNPLQFLTPAPAPVAAFGSMSNWGSPGPRAFPVATANGPTAESLFGVGGVYGPDNSDVGGGFNPALAGPAGADPAAAPGMFAGLSDWMKGSGILGSYDPKTGMKTDGWGSLALGAAQGLGGLYMGMQQYNLAKETLANNKAQFERNYAAQKTTTNANLEDRQRARVASNAGAYQSVGDYMAQNGVK
jgi:hypothetical protein